MAFLTPDQTEETVIRVFIIPATLSPYLTGAVEILARQEFWEKFGEMTPEECAEVFENWLHSLA